MSDIVATATWNREWIHSPNEKLHCQAYLEYNSWPKVLRNSLRNKGYIRWVDDQLDIHEDFFGLVHIEQTDAKSLYIATKICHNSLLTATFALSWWRVTRFSEMVWSRRDLRYIRILLYSLVECVCKKHTSVYHHQRPPWYCDTRWPLRQLPDLVLAEVSWVCNMTK